MNKDLQFFCNAFWAALVITVGLCIWLFIVTRRRELWLRIVAAETSFLTRLGVPKKIIGFGRISEKPAFAYYLAGCIILYMLLALLNGWSYLHFKNRLSTMRPPEASSYYETGATRNKAGDYVGAITNFTKAIEIYSNYEDAYSFRARAKYNLQDYKGAISDANKAIEINQHYEPAYNVRADTKGALKDYAGSIADLNKSINLDPSYAPAYSGRGLAEVGLTNFTAAVKDFTKAISLRQNYAFAYYYRGVAEQGQTNYVAAILDFSNAIASKINFSDAYNRRGLAKWYLNDFDGTIEDCTEAIRLDPKSWAAFNNRGLAKSDLGEFSTAVADLNKSIELNSNYAATYVNRGGAEFHLKDFKAAINDYNKSIELDPSDASAYAGLGLVHNYLFQFELALTNLEKALQLDPTQEMWRIRIWLIRAKVDDRVGATNDLKNYFRSTKLKKLTWYKVIASYLTGDLSEKDFLNCAKANTAKVQKWWQCQANYYAGMKHLIEGDKIGAMNFFQQCLNSNERQAGEYISAEAELNALKKVIPP